MLARVTFSALFVLLLGIGFYSLVLGFNQTGTAQTGTTQTGTGTNLSERPAVQERQDPFAGLDSNPLPFQQSLSGGNGFGLDSEIEIQTDEKLGRYLPNTKRRVQLIHDIEVPALEAGQVAEILVTENQPVTPQTVLAKLRDKAAQLQKSVATKNRSVALVEAENENRITYAEEGLNYANKIRNSKELLLKRNTISATEVDEARYQVKQAQLQYDEARVQQQVAKSKLAVEDVNIMAADDLINRHNVTSLLAFGEVAELFVQAGEWVNRGDKVARVIDMKNLKITGRANAKKIYPEQIANRPVLVSVSLPDDKIETFVGRVIRVSLENSVSDNFYFQVNVENRKRGDFWILRPNAEVDIKVLLDQQ